VYNEEWSCQRQMGNDQGRLAMILQDSRLWRL
jgi:hypothetical protein